MGHHHICVRPWASMELSVLLHIEHVELQVRFLPKQRELNGGLGPTLGAVGCDDGYALP